MDREDGTYDASTPAGPNVVMRVSAFVMGVLDISGSPRRRLFEILSHFVSTELERDRLEYFSTAQGRDDMYTYNQSEGRTLLEVLQVCFCSMLCYKPF